MKMTIDLNLNDVKNIIAMHFGVDSSNVYIAMNECSVNGILNGGAEFVTVYDNRNVRLKKEETRAKKLERMRKEIREKNESKA